MRELNPQKLEHMAGQLVNAASLSMTSLLLYLADQSGVFRQMDKTEQISADDLAIQCGVDGRYLREMLLAFSAHNYTDYHPDTDTFSLNPEQRAVFAKEDEPTCMLGIFQVIVAQFAEFESALEEFKTGRGRPWSSHHSCQFCGTNRFFRPGYVANLTREWIPALQGVEAKLKAGARIADVGCGLGSSSILMAQQYPNSHVSGFDSHDDSIVYAKQAAEEEKLGNISFNIADAGSIPGSQGYDLICIFDALHDMGDPVGVASYLRECLQPGGTLMVVEPLAGDAPQENMHTLGALFYAASTLVCLPNSRSQPVGLCLGAQAGPAKLQQVLTDAGFRSVNIACASATNIVLEAK